MNQYRERGWKKSGNLWQRCDKDQPVNCDQSSIITKEIILLKCLAICTILLTLTKFSYFHNHSINIFTIFTGPKKDKLWERSQNGILANGETQPQMFSAWHTYIDRPVPLNITFASPQCHSHSQVVNMSIVVYKFNINAIKKWFGHYDANQ